MSLSSSEESRGTLSFTVSITRRGRLLWFSIPAPPLGSHIPPSRHQSPQAGRDTPRSRSCSCWLPFPKASHHQRAVEDDALLGLAAFPVFVIQ